MRIDLHMHSTASDGTSSPAELARECKASGIERAALTDHDTTEGVAEFLAAAEEAGVEAVSGIEFSVDYEDEMHILAYGVNINYAPLNDAVKRMKRERRDRAYIMIDNLRAHGISISAEEVITAAGGGELIGRPHLAMVLAAHGYAKDVETAFPQFLDEGCIGYAPRLKIDRMEAISLGKAAGGKLVLAHPLLTHAKDFPKLFSELREQGLDGIEAYYPIHSDEQADFFRELAFKNGMFVTGGSDYHGSIRKSRNIGMERRGNEFVKEGSDIIFGKK